MISFSKILRPLCLVLQAHHPEKNHYRQYVIALDQDLFGEWLVTIQYGRTGQWGKEIHIACRNLEECRRRIQERLSRRLSAPRRIGCAYTLQRLEMNSTIIIASDWKSLWGPFLSPSSTITFSESV